ncbi:hypothetical protein BAUCODRAFT_22905 [Baudoinia panamericana UAMH 10762]|uniref:Uncharacterized protein n=1 Tax=Baudoinia panamericana (strain UAMH 10762) TaxID=717646 RepID=M2MN11_BAUPA|nr:uncharacterized protein BAUCODRAFT_22905 [Baudoinia panamericana UAMH 10762]EMC98061.1 hypothetical protein BAUCODRAFT_22905 [Baudoinia panamericana UAMH 10762]
MALIPFKMLPRDQWQPRPRQSREPPRARSRKKQNLTATSPARFKASTPLSAITEGSGHDRSAPIGQQASDLHSFALHNESVVEKNVLSTIEPPDVVLELGTAKESNAIVLNPRKCERQYYRDTVTGIKREVWQPGDGDGQMGSDYPEAMRLPPDSRWRFYQSSSVQGPITKDNMPPKFVVLDDLNTYLVWHSDIPSLHKAVFWAFDFGGVGFVLTRRPHRGRGAVACLDAEGNANYRSGNAGQSGKPYHFTGEKGYKPIVYRSNDPPETLTYSSKRKANSPAPGELKQTKKAGQHNQYTPKEEMVKFGGPSKSGRQPTRRARMEAFLKSDPTVELSGEGGIVNTGLGQGSEAFAASLASHNPMRAALTGVANIAGAYSNIPTPYGVPLEQRLVPESDRTTTIEDNDDMIVLSPSRDKAATQATAAQSDHGNAIKMHKVNEGARQLLGPEAYKYHGHFEQSATFIEQNTDSVIKPQNQIRMTGANGCAAAIMRSVQKAQLMVVQLKTDFNQAQSKVVELEGLFLELVSAANVLKSDMEA